MLSKYKIKHLISKSSNIQAILEKDNNNDLINELLHQYEA